MVAPFGLAGKEAIPPPIGAIEPVIPDAIVTDCAQASGLASFERHSPTTTGKLHVLATARLDDLAEINVTSGALRVIADPYILAGIPRRNTGGRPSEHGDFLRPLIDKRIRAGEALHAINAEFRAVRAAFQAAHPDRPIPSESAIKRYIREARRGS